ncbi:restriction endonuclease subunit S [Streptococcus pseudopneumoniae]|uniref:restriction endonuclease subunit S n=2 Tax=Streptococcus pseudopneumoniae TaxID=257758 RepID=UPI0018B08420|nr:restriction endonuclease subunit S [Streptococcus pseudopneumoniae]MBF9635685.1 restriction endonuclease subunit S [Streptococcus pseudopneumoniae]MBF9653991.1 restriction endonuclease subunit S [Streptococcus pseudopneumoniae]MBF9670720.1 restriction endonuclease subunit S [Streptococcus pseudopneumoniae]MBF9674894.1 restriction endonuclease subunit S [Streptococcus pseudopneumoniae]
MKKVKLGELVSIQTGKLDANAAVVGGKYPFFTTAKEILWINDYVYDDEVVLVAGNGDLNVKYYKGKFNAYQRTYILSNNSNVKMKYLYYFLDKYIEILRYQSIGGVIKYIKFNNLSNALVPMMSVSEQENIIQNFEKIDYLISKRSQQYTELSNLVKSRFNEMFGDPLNNNKKFAVKTGQQCFKFSSGKFLDKHDRVFEGYPAYGGNGIAWKSRKYLIDNPTIIIGRVGAYCGNVRTTHGKVWISDNAIYIKEFKNSDFNLVFLLELMKVIDFSKFADFSGQPKITQKPLENQKYILPPLALQNEFADFVALVDKSQLAIQKSLEELETLKKSLMQEYFS